MACDPAVFLNNTAYADGVGKFAVVQTESAVACCLKCAAAEPEGCFWFSYEHAAAKCYLKKNDRNPQPRTGVTSGPTHHNH